MQQHYDLVFLLIHLLVEICQSEISMTVHMCSFQTVNGVIDLRPLGNTNNTPRFKEIADPRGLFTYYWNPCYPFNLHQCKNTSVCQFDIKKGLYHALGTEVALRHQIHHNWPVLQYSADDDVYRTVDIILICKNNIEAEIKFIKEHPNTYYTFELRSKYACSKQQTLTTLPVTSRTITRLDTFLISVSPQKHHHYIFEKITLFLIFIIIVAVSLSMIFLTGLCVLVYKYTLTSSSYNRAEQALSLTSYENLTEFDFVNHQIEHLNSYNVDHQKDS